jgi:hypothetical protein
MTRPKESFFGLVAGMASIYTANKARKLNQSSTTNNTQNNIYHVLHNDMSGVENQLESLSDEIRSNLIQQNNVLSTIQTSSCLTIQGLVDIFHSIENLAQQQWEVLNFMNEMDRKEEVLGTLRMFLFNVEREIKKIDTMFSSHPEFSFLMMQDLEYLFLSKKITQDKFKRMHIDEFRWANSVMENVSKQSEILTKRIQHNPTKFQNAVKLRETINEIAESEAQIARISENLSKFEGVDEIILGTEKINRRSNLRRALSRAEEEIEEYWKAIIEFLPSYQSSTNLLDDNLTNSDL